MSNTAWAYIACKGDYWGGIISDRAGPKELGKFMSEFVKDGFSIINVSSRDEYVTKIGAMKPWFESPDFKPKTSRKAKFV